MPITVTLANQTRILPLRARHHQEMNSQIVHDSIHLRQGWTLSYELQVNDQPVGFGSVAVAGPSTDISEPHRRKGYGSYLVQELKRECYELGAIPAARCSPTNIASRSTLTKAGFAPCAHILLGDLKPE